jgi:transposase
MNSKRHTVLDALGVSVADGPDGGPTQRLHRRKGFLSRLTSAKHRLADQGYDTDWHREAPKDKAGTPFTSRKGRKTPIPRNKIRNSKRREIENSWRIATRYNRSPKDFASACALAAVIMLWL